MQQSKAPSSRGGAMGFSPQNDLSPGSQGTGIQISTGSGAIGGSTGIISIGGSATGSGSIGVTYSVGSGPYDPYGAYTPYYPKKAKY